MTPDELADQVQKVLLAEEFPPFEAHGRADTWGEFGIHIPIGTSWADWAILCKATSQVLITRGVIKPDNRRHKGIGVMQGSYRLSRGWYNRNR